MKVGGLAARSRRAALRVSDPMRDHSSIIAGIVGVRRSEVMGEREYGPLSCIQEVAAARQDFAGGPLRAVARGHFPDGAETRSPLQSLEGLCWAWTASVSMKVAATVVGE